jgi:hypothetical protein
VEIKEREDAFSLFINNEEIRIGFYGWMNFERFYWDYHALSLKLLWNVERTKNRLKSVIKLIFYGQQIIFIVEKKIFFSVRKFSSVSIRFKFYSFKEFSLQLREQEDFFN